ncbi:hypothetical protein DZF91_14100 [Actinomadura logoneensis]|uniref:SMI1/KNR4 family protein n=1 Tax=Actinomadura logoneensis TaxID=2293572 RepID=A0A372JNV2_9ACTN|nr:hypothetical protein [Actinomadura logoneensis]RFU41018.1 hypothetical protein DZF91_14100 [Actinomadura logoneensis]
MAWTEETPSWQDVVNALREAAAGGDAALDEALGDEAMDAWDVPVPDEIREIYRRVGLFWLNRGEEFGPVRDDRAERCGEPGSYLLVHSNPAAETYYVDIDRESGAWGPVFMFWEDHGARMVAPSLQHWLVTVASYVRRAARDADAFEDFDTAFMAWFFGDFDEADDDYPHDSPDVVARLADDAVAEILDVAEAGRSGDPVLADVAGRLPDDALIADLRQADRPTALPFERHPAWSRRYEAVYMRFCEGRVIAATPLVLQPR